MVDRDAGNGEGGSLPSPDQIPSSPPRKAAAPAAGISPDDIPTAPLVRSKVSTEPKPEPKPEPRAAALAAEAPPATAKPRSSGYEETIDGQLLSQQLATELPPLEQWDLYEILGLLGKGGMGVVYKARDRRLGRLVALKFIRGDDVVLVRRLKQEARAQASIEHPHVCKVYEVGEFHGQAYIAMQFIDGQPLAVVQRELTQPDKVLTMAMVAEAVHAAHRQGIIHRDLKPSNAAKEGEGQRIVPPQGKCLALAGWGRNDCQGGRNSSYSLGLDRVQFTLMRFVSRIDLYLPADIIERSPMVWDKLQSLWTTVDLRTDRERNRVEAATIVYDFRRVLDDLGIDNARSLVIDGETVFHDHRGVPSDLPNLILALSEHTAIFGSGGQELRLSVEHEEAGLRLVAEVTVTSEHARGAAAARVSVLGEVIEFTPQPGERADDYRARVHALVAEPSRRVALRLQFGSFISRLEAALKRHFAEARLVVTTEALDMALMSDELPPLPAPRRSSPTLEATAAPPRNFTLSVEQRIAAMVTGPPPYAVRLRRIEDLESAVIATLIETGAVNSLTIPVAVARSIEELNRLIGEHNRYYPVERNLAIDVRSGQLLDGGEPWKPKPEITIDALRNRARAGDL